MTTTMATDQLPNGFEVQLKDDLIRAESRRVLVGGSPVRAVRLSEPAQALLSSGRVVVGDSTSAHLARRLLDGNLADPVLDNIEIESSDLTVVVPVRDRADQQVRQEKKEFDGPTQMKMPPCGTEASSSMDCVGQPTCAAGSG